ARLRRETPGAVGGEGGDQVLLGGEVPVNGSDADLGDLGDVGHLAVEPLIGEQPLGRGDHGLAVAPGVRALHSLDSAVLGWSGLGLCDGCHWVQVPSPRCSGTVLMLTLQTELKFRIVLIETGTPFPNTKITSPSCLFR